MRRICSCTFQKTRNFENGLKWGIPNAFTRIRRRKEVSCINRVNRTKRKPVRVVCGAKSMFLQHPLSDIASCDAVAVQTQVFPARAGCSPERTAGQTACPVEFLARARKVCGELKGAGLA
jgi:hypothetical protein